MAAMVAGYTEGLARDYHKRNPQLAQSHVKCTYGALQPVNVKPIIRVLESVEVRCFDLQA